MQKRLVHISNRSHDQLKQQFYLHISTSLSGVDGLDGYSSVLTRPDGLFYSISLAAGHREPFLKTSILVVIRVQLSKLEGLGLLGGSEKSGRRRSPSVFSNLNRPQSDFTTRTNLETQAPAARIPLSQHKNHHCASGRCRFQARPPLLGSGTRPRPATLVSPANGGVHDGEPTPLPWSFYQDADVDVPQLMFAVG